MGFYSDLISLRNALTCTPLVTPRHCIIAPAPAFPDSDGNRRSLPSWKRSVLFHHILSNMNKFLASLLLVAIATQGASAFTSKTSLSTRQITRTSKPLNGPSFEVPSATSSTALNLKVKVDPNKKTDNSKGNAKMAAYGGSVAIAVALPIAFLIWSAVSK